MNGLEVVWDGTVRRVVRREVMQSHHMADPVEVEIVVEDHSELLPPRDSKAYPYVVPDDYKGLSPVSPRMAMIRRRKKEAKEREGDAA